MNNQQEQNQLALFTKNPMMMLSELNNISMLPEAVQEKFAMMAHTKIQQAFDWEIAVKISQSSMVPANYINNPANTFLAIQTGRSLGLDEFQSVQHLYTVNGKTSLYGDMMLALAKKDPKFIDCLETQGGLVEVDDAHGKLPEWVKCVVKVKGQADKEMVYTLEMAKLNRNFGNSKTPWMNGHAARLMKFRARSFALRDALPDRLSGVYDEYEIQEVKDITTEVNQATGLDEMEKEFQDGDINDLQNEENPDLKVDQKKEEQDDVGPMALRLKAIVDKPENQAAVQMLLKGKSVSPSQLRSKDEKEAKSVYELLMTNKEMIDKASKAAKAKNDNEETSPEQVVRNDIARLIELGETKQATLFQNSFERIPEGDGYYQALEPLSIQLRKAVLKAEKK